MKLIYCKECKDIVRLRWWYINRTCECGLSGGHCVGYEHTEIWGEAIPLGVDKRSFWKALKERPKEGKGSLFTAFVIPEECETVEEVDK